MPLAIQYGMPLDEFWHGDLRLLKAYQKAYYKNTQYTAWWHGNYNHLAVMLGVNNAFSKAEQRQDFVEYKDFTEKLYQKQPTVTKENLEKTFRQQMIDQQEWFRNTFMNK